MLTQIKEINTIINSIDLSHETISDLHLCIEALRSFLVNMDDLKKELTDKKIYFCSHNHTESITVCNVKDLMVMLNIEKGDKYSWTVVSTNITVTKSCKTFKKGFQSAIAYIIGEIIN